MNAARYSSGRLVRVLLGIGVTLAFLAWALRGMSFSIIANTMENARLEWLLLGLIVFLASFSLRARRWGTLLGLRRDPEHFKIRHAAIFIGTAGNCVLPAHAGEIARAMVLCRFVKVPFGLALGSIFAERMLDMIVVFVFLLVPFFLDGIGQTSGASIVYLGWIGVALAVLSGILVVLARRPESIARLAEAVSKAVGLGHFTPPIVAGVRTILAGLGALRNPRQCIVAVVETFCIWTLTGITYWSGMVAFGITSPGITGALFVQSAATLGIVIPSTPGYFGPFEAAIRFALEAYGIPANLVIAYALGIHILIYGSVTAVGFAFATHLGLSWRDLTHFRGSSESSPRCKEAIAP